MGIRYSAGKGRGSVKGQFVDPSSPRPGAEYFNSETGEVEEVASAANQISQPNYSRGAASRQTSPRLLGLQGCVRNQLSGTSHNGRKEVLSALNDASKRCKNQLDDQGVPGGIPSQFESTFEG